MTKQLIDLSQPIDSAMPVYPGDEQTSLVQTRSLAGDHHVNHRLTISMHAGTHVDSPMHLLPSDAYISELPLAPFVAPGCLLDVRGQDVIAWRPEYEQLIGQGEIVLLYTGHDRQHGMDSYYTASPVVDPAFCEQLLRKQCPMLGMDLPSPDQPPFPVHKRLLSSGVYILENLTNLSRLLSVPRFEVIALPLRLRADSSPVRAVARVLAK